MPVLTLEDVRKLAGQPLGASDWIAIDQDRISAFAEATEDRQFIHVDEALAAQTPFGGTIAHGFLSLSLLSRMAADVLPVPDTAKMVVNYGLDRVRFINPVKRGSRVRGHFTLDAVEDKAPGQILLKQSVTVEIEGAERPALNAQWLGLIFI